LIAPANQIERRRHAAGSSLSQQLKLNAFFQVCAEQQRVSSCRIALISAEMNSPHRDRNFRSCSQKQHEQMSRSPRPSRRAQSLQIRLLMPTMLTISICPSSFDNAASAEGEISMGSSTSFAAARALPDPTRFFPSRFRARPLIADGSLHYFSRILSSSRASARVSPYSGKTQIVSNSAEPFVVQIL